MQRAGRLPSPLLQRGRWQQDPRDFTKFCCIFTNCASLAELMICIYGKVTWIYPNLFHE